MIYNHRLRILSLPPQSSVGLLVKFQRPCDSKPDDTVAAALKIQPMTGRSRVDQTDRKLTGIPPLNALAAVDLVILDLLLIQSFPDPFQIMLVPVRYQNRFSIGGLNQVFQGIPLRRFLSAASRCLWTIGWEQFIFFAISSCV